MRVRLHIGGIITLDIEDGLEPGTDGFADAVNDAYSDFGDGELLDAISEEWRILRLNGVPQP